MALLPVTQYAASWNPVANKSWIAVSVGNGKPSQVPIETPEEFTILLLMLGKSGVMFDTVTKEIEIPIRPTGS